MSRSLAAVVLNYRTPERTLACVRSLRQSARAPDHIIVVDNGGECRELLSGRLEAAELLVTPRNLGFASGNNIGIRRALERGTGYILVVNPDVAVSSQCIGLLERELLDHPEAGIAGPTVVRASAPRVISSMGIAYSPRTGRMRLLRRGRRLPEVPRPDPGARIVDGVEGCAMLLRAELFHEVGFFSDDYFLYFEDLELCLRARRSGFLTLVVPMALASHEGAASTGALPERRLYFTCRNHLRLAQQAFPLSRLASAARAINVVGLNLAHLLIRAPAPRTTGFKAVARGVLDHLRHRYGDPELERTR